jgi:hypothetical protein
MTIGGENTDRELYREPDLTGNGSYYSNSLHVTKSGSIGINVAGLVFFKTLAEWHRLASLAAPSILGFPVVECDQAPKNKVTFMPGGSVIGAFTVDDPSLD